jgi:ribosomal-protein-alanine N-acetyltransferase
LVCTLRTMHKEDVAQVSEIDREAFPTMWPPPNYERELNNRMSYYIVAYDEEKSIEPPIAKTKSGKNLPGLMSGLKRLISHDRLSDSNDSLTARQYITGFVGFWVMADEAHITSIAVREKYRRQGIGELLLISVIDRALESKINVITLEVRASNTGAQALYYKYGFNKVGVRKGYYTDNREDGFIMSTDDINTASFQARLQQLKQAHSLRWGISNHQVAR